MAGYIPIEKNPYYKRSQSISKDIGPEKPTIHFYPDVTDEILQKKDYEIPFLHTYTSTQEAIGQRKDDIHTLQMGFANPLTAQSYSCFFHFLDPNTDTQKIALVDFSRTGDVIVKEWL